ncbi:MAG TPA: hypothetical protein QGG47_13975 [Acidobacteriota bacterium]|nr:hypothetical protein [Acidobacteriota bacterium]
MTKARTLLSAVLALGLLFLTLGHNRGERPMTLRVTGTTGVHFTGHYVVHAGGQESRQTLDQEVAFDWTREQYGHVSAGTP